MSSSKRFLSPLARTLQRTDLGSPILHPIEKTSWIGLVEEGPLFKLVCFLLQQHKGNERQIFLQTGFSLFWGLTRLLSTKVYTQQKFTSLSLHVASRSGSNMSWLQTRSLQAYLGGWDNQGLVLPQFLSTHAPPCLKIRLVLLF